MGGGASKDAALQSEYTRVQSSVDARVRYVQAMRAAIAGGAPVDVEDAEGLASGQRSKVRRMCVVRSSDGTYECEYVAALKCGDDKSGEFTFDTAVASLLSRLVAAHVSPHFTLLIHANASLQTSSASSSSAAAAAVPRRVRDRERERDRDRCALLELNEITLSKFLEIHSPSTAAAFGITFQIAHAMLAAFVSFGVSHNDLHRQNVMGVRVPPDTVYEYDVFGTRYVVPLHGWLWKLIDFDRADVGASHSHAKYTYMEKREAKLQDVAGPAMDVAAAAPPQVQNLIDVTVRQYIKERGIASPAVHVGALCNVLSICYKRMTARDDADDASADAGAGAGAGSSLSSGIVADCRFSLSNDASQVAAAYDDGLGLTFASAKSYYLVAPEFAPIRNIKRVLQEYGEARALPAMVPHHIPQLKLTPPPRRHDAEPPHKKRNSGGSSTGTGAGAGAGAAATVVDLTFSG